MFKSVFAQVARLTAFLMPLEWNCIERRYAFRSHSRQKRGLSMKNPIEITDGTEHSSQLQISIDKDDFREFISGVLSKDGKIGFHSNCKFVIKKDDIINISNLLNQRAKEQNNTYTINEEIGIIYKNGRVEKFSSISSFSSHSHIVDDTVQSIIYSSDFFIRPENRDIPIRHNIEIAFSLPDFETSEPSTSPANLHNDASSFPKTTILISFGLRTWAEDAKNLLHGVVTSKIHQPGAIYKAIIRPDGAPRFYVIPLMLMSLIAICTSVLMYSAESVGIFNIPGFFTENQFSFDFRSIFFLVILSILTAPIGFAALSIACIALLKFFKYATFNNRSYIILSDTHKETYENDIKRRQQIIPGAVVGIALLILGGVGSVAWQTFQTFEKKVELQRNTPND